VLIPVEGVIVPRLEQFLSRRLDEARDKGADLVILEIDSPGGLLEQSFNMANRLRSIDWAHTVAFVPEQAVGFVVDTPLGRVRDLGTEFGVAVDGPEMVDVVVFTGLVEVHQEGAKAVRLGTDEGRKLRRGKSPAPITTHDVAFRFPKNPALSRPRLEPGNLVRNPSFEIGSLSRVPSSGRQYRDRPSGWEAVRLDPVSSEWVPVEVKVLWMQPTF